MAMTKSELTSYITIGDAISIGSDISLTGSVEINGVTGLEIYGNGSTIDGQRIYDCFSITRGSKISCHDFVFSDGYTYGTT